MNPDKVFKKRVTWILLNGLLNSILIVIVYFLTSGLFFWILAFSIVAFNLYSITKLTDKIVTYA